VLAATPLTFRYGAVGTAVGVGITFLVGLLVTYYFVRRTLPNLSLRDAFVTPIIASLVTLAAALFFAGWVNTLALPLIVSLTAELLVTIALYSGLSFALRPHATLERGRYVWSLLRRRQAV
jgi:hypothetical protein